jgi:hypothetical protein
MNLLPDSAGGKKKTHRSRAFCLDDVRSLFTHRRKRRCRHWQNASAFVAFQASALSSFPFFFLFVALVHCRRISAPADPCAATPVCGKACTTCCLKVSSFFSCFRLHLTESGKFFLQ